MEQDIIPKSKILVFKLNTGEDIISICYEFPSSETDGYHFQLVEPMSIASIMEEDDKGNNTISTMLIPWINRKVVDKPLFKLYASEIMTTVEPSKKVKNLYNRKISYLIKKDEEDNLKEIDKEVRKELKFLESLDDKKDRKVTRFVNKFFKDLTKRNLKET